MSTATKTTTTKTIKITPTDEAINAAKNMIVDTVRAGDFSTALNVSVQHVNNLDTEARAVMIRSIMESAIDITDQLKAANADIERLKSGFKTLTSTPDSREMLLYKHALELIAECPVKGGNGFALALKQIAKYSLGENGMTNITNLMNAIGDFGETHSDSDFCALSEQEFNALLSKGLSKSQGIMSEEIARLIRDVSSALNGAVAVKTTTPDAKS